MISRYKYTTFQPRERARVALGWTQGAALGSSKVTREQQKRKGREKGKGKREMKNFGPWMSFFPFFSCSLHESSTPFIPNVTLGAVGGF